MAKCVYCARPLKMWGLKCYACRRFVLRRGHVILLIAAAVVAAVLLLGAVELLVPPPLAK